MQLLFKLPLIFIANDNESVSHIVNLLLFSQNKAEAPVWGRRPADDSVPAQGLHENVPGQ